MLVGEVEYALDHADREVRKAFVDFFGRRSQGSIDYKGVWLDPGTLDCEAASASAGNALDEFARAPENNRFFRSYLDGVHICIVPHVK